MNEVIMERLEAAKGEIVANIDVLGNDISAKMMARVCEMMDMLEEVGRSGEAQPAETRKSVYLKAFSESDCRLFFPEKYIKRLVDNAVGDALFINKKKLWDAYKEDCKKAGMMHMERQCMNAALYLYGYKDYYYIGKPCWWRPGSVKPRPGKRAKRKEDKQYGE